MANYKDLQVWQKAMDLASEVYLLTEKLSRAELYGLTNQMRRAVVSIPSNIAEGYGRSVNGTNRDFKRFLTIAKGSATELETQLLLCVRVEMLKNEDIEKSLNLLDEIQRILTAFIRSLGCK